MSGFDPNSVNWHDGLLAGWTYDKPVSKWFQGGFRNAHRITRPCPTCSDVYAIEVTTAALLGRAQNHGLGLRRCKACRAALKRNGISNEYAERKEAGKATVETANPAPVNGFPKINNEAGKYTVEGANAELEAAYDVNMKLMSDHAALRQRYEAVFAELQVCKAKLAQYELPAAMQQIANKMPWNA